MISPEGNPPHPPSQITSRPCLFFVGLNEHNSFLFEIRQSLSRLLAAYSISVESVFMCMVPCLLRRFFVPFPVSLRMQVMEASESGGVVGGRSLERCFAEYVVCNMVLFLVVMNFMG